MWLLVMALALEKQRRLISSNIFVFLHFDISHADSLTDLIRLIEPVRSTPRKKRGIYWTKVSIDTLVLVGMRAVFSERKRKSKVLQILESRTDSFCFHEHARCYHRPQIRTNKGRQFARKWSILIAWSLDRIGLQARTISSCDSSALKKHCEPAILVFV